MLNLRNRAIGFAFVATLVTATPVMCADAPTGNAHSLALARHLFAEMHMDQLMAGMVTNMTPAMVAQARKANPALTEDQAQIITQAISESSEAMMTKAIERIIPLYASTFTEKELEDLVGFYDGPTGQAMLNKMPVLMSKMGPVMTELMPGMMADVNQRICSKMDCSKRAPPPASKS
jgi:uncharacterized protein